MANLITTGTSGYQTGEIDTATTLVNGISPRDAKHPNGIAAAVIQVETILGVGPDLKGSAADLVARLAVEHNADGSQKTLPTGKGGTGKTYDVVPTGCLLIWTTVSAPTGFLLCDGTAVSRTTYSALFAVIGTTYGAGDGSTTFNLPDLRGRVVIMVDGSASRITSASTGGTNADTLGGVGGAQTHTLVTDEMPAHTHTYTFDTAFSGLNQGRGRDDTDVDLTPTASHTSGSTGSGGAHSNTQPWIALEYIIKY